MTGVVGAVVGAWAVVLLGGRTSRLPEGCPLACSEANLIGHDLRGVNLSGASLYGADLAGVMRH
ncbi:MAG: pentapeptide repeat-containing protein [Acidobacteriota bacterium]